MKIKLIEICGTLLIRRTLKPSYNNAIITTKLVHHLDLGSLNLHARIAFGPPDGPVSFPHCILGNYLTHSVFALVH